MASNKPRYGGGTKMEHNAKLLTDIASHEAMSSNTEFTPRPQLSSGRHCCDEGKSRKFPEERYDVLTLGACANGTDDGGSPAWETAKECKRTPVKCTHAFDCYSQPIHSNQAFENSLKCEQSRHNDGDGFGTVQRREMPECRNKPCASIDQTSDSSNDPYIDMIQRFESRLAIDTQMVIATFPSGDLKKVVGLFDMLEKLDINRQPRVYTRLQTEQEANKDTFENSCIDNKTTTVEESNIIYCKNLFVKDKKKQFYFVITDERHSVDLKTLKDRLKVTRNLSFANRDDMIKILQLNPGEVTPFALINKSAENVRVIVDDSLLHTQTCDDVLLAFHPLHPSLQVEISYSELHRFLSHHNKTLEVLGQPKPINRQESRALSICDDENNEFLANEDTAKFSQKHTPVISVDKRMKLGDRKGKLKSYLKKRVTAKDKELAIFSKNNSNGFDLKRPISSNNSFPAPVDRSRSDDDSSNRTYWEAEKAMVPLAPVNLYEISLSNRYLPEITEFYKTLEEHKIAFTEIELSSSNSQNIGPALGAKVVVLKDRRNNFFLVISHEFYEPDYGRLKQALKPRKKLEICPSVDLLSVLGVDKDHLTPFAVMNSRAKENKINMYFTEKIILYENTILCIKHPFCLGKRIIMKSTELRRLLEHFAGSTSIGIVKEKVWNRRYMRPFTQFEDRSLATNLDNSVIDGQQLTEANDVCNTNGNRFVRKSDCSNNINQSNITNESNLVNGSDIAFKNGDQIYRKRSIQDVMKVLFQVICSFGGYITPNSLTHPMDSSGDQTRSSSVDPETLEQFKNQYIDDTLLSSSIINVNFDNSQLEQDFDIKPMNDTSGVITEPSINQNPAPFLDEEIVSLPEDDFIPVDSDSEKPEEEIDKLEALQNYYSKYDNAGYDVYVRDIHALLENFNINFRIVDNSVKFQDNDIESAVEESEETMIQVCSTLHLVDESGTHYFVVSMACEQVPVKRFCRRFQLKKKVFVVERKNRPGCVQQTASGTIGEKCHLHDVIDTNNPFSLFLYLLRCQGGDFDISNLPNGSKKLIHGKTKLVLFSSIYMDPDMSCVFELHRQGTGLVLSAEQLEQFAKRVGMEVWYMP